MSADALIIDLKTEPQEPHQEMSSNQPQTRGKSRSRTRAATQQQQQERATSTGASSPSLAQSKPKRSTKSPYQVSELMGAVETVHIDGFEIKISTVTVDSHGWILMEGVKMPYIVRKGLQKFIPLSFIEKTLLKPYPGPYPEHELGRAPMMGFYLTTEEVRLLNRFVVPGHATKIGLGRFSLKDMLVTLPDFVDFYQKVKSIVNLCPQVVEAPEVVPVTEVQGGWAQVNNTIVPYVLRNRVKMVPLSVMRFAAGLLKDVEVPSLEANLKERSYLNEACAEMSLDFQFQETTRLLELFLVPTLSKGRVTINELPPKDPLLHARFVSKSNDRRSVFVAASVRSQEIQKECHQDKDSVPADTTTNKGPPTVNGGQIKSKADSSNRERKKKTPSPHKTPTPPQISQSTLLPLVPTPPAVAKTPPGQVPQPGLKIIQLPASMTTGSPAPPAVIISQANASPSPTIIRLPVDLSGGVNFCPQHGLRAPQAPPNGAVTQHAGQSPVILRPQNPVANMSTARMLVPSSSNVIAPPQPAPIMVIRLPSGAQSGTPIILSPQTLQTVQQQPAQVLQQPIQLLQQPTQVLQQQPQVLQEQPQVLQQQPQVLQSQAPPLFSINNNGAPLLVPAIKTEKPSKEQPVVIKIESDDEQEAADDVTTHDDGAITNVPFPNDVIGVAPLVIAPESPFVKQENDDSDGDNVTSDMTTHEETPNDDVSPSGAVKPRAGRKRDSSSDVNAPTTSSVTTEGEEPEENVLTETRQNPEADYVSENSPSLESDVPPSKRARTTCGDTEDVDTDSIDQTDMSRASNDSSGSDAPTNGATDSETSADVTANNASCDNEASSIVVTQKDANANETSNGTPSTEPATDEVA